VATVAKIRSVGGPSSDSSEETPSSKIFCGGLVFSCYTGSKDADGQPCADGLEEAKDFLHPAQVIFPNSYVGCYEPLWSFRKKDRPSDGKKI